MISQLFLPIAATLLAYVLFHAAQIVYRNLTSPLRHVVGPRSPSLILGNFKEMADDPALAEKWREEFGPNFLFRGLFSMSELHTSDLKALNHIVTNSSIYQKAEYNRKNTTRLVGKGILGVESDEHRRHRRILNPAFGVAQIRNITEIFVEKATQLRDIWAHEVAKQGGEGHVDALSWLRRMTLDVIGQAGFNYQFDSLATKEKPNEMTQVFTELFHSPYSRTYATFRLTQSIAPILKLIPMPGWRILRAAHGKMYAIGCQIVSKSKANILAADGEKTLGNRRDLLSVLLRANISTGLAENQRLSEAEVIAQIPTFFLAGHETTSSATAWALHALSLNTAVQTTLREELMTLGTDNPTMDELNSLPYLEKVVRETMRAYSPVVFTQRMATADDVLPLSKPYIDKEGNEHYSLPIPKGQMIHIPIWGVNTSKEIWGEDAREFRPERWEHVPEAVSAVPGMWANLFTFFAGPHNCIGFRFSLVELKALLFMLIRAFEVHPAVPKGSIVPVTAGLLQRPAVLAEMGKGSGLPLILKAVNTEAF
ncbi:cytochrome P450 [Mycena pura]|uniref:Cytochrome P450 n=1 Tax=Mycena pura TaxID=153505 RepID=A0AAD6UNP8_9AGAR|nr:cytochrome P450 [Mycena pura]